MTIDQEFDLIREYLNVIIQILPETKQCGGTRIDTAYLPSFEYFKRTYDDRAYSLAIPAYKESLDLYGKVVSKVGTHGLGSDSGIAYRFCNYWMGCKFYTGGNIHGDYTIDQSLTNKLKSI